ncbi:MAG: beta-lactamase superfamily II metal-dependent hydrolase [Paracoccaceae bacterium]|jgi:beta-lactamase superfamily II metal-dependent hydrolase
MWNNQLKGGDQYYIGVIEEFEQTSVEDSPYARWLLIIDAVLSKDFIRGQSTDQWIYDANTAFLRSVSTRKKFHELSGLDAGLEKGAWVEITVGSKPTSTPIWGYSTALNAQQDAPLGKAYIQRISILDDDPQPKSAGAATTAQKVSKKRAAREFDLKQLARKAGSNASQSIYQKLGQCISGIVHDVGQASANSFSTDKGKTIYFDVGRPLWFQGFTMNKNKKLPTPDESNGDLIILSHWDWDHYAYGRFDPDFHKVNWIAPSQIVGPSAYKFAKKLHDQNKLYLFHGSLKNPIQCPAFKLYRDGSKPKDRNGSGLVAEIRLKDNRLILLTGDCDYVTCAQLSPNATYDRVIIPHHGGASGGNPPKIKKHTRNPFIVSYGLNNKYRHPKFAELKTHAQTDHSIVGTAQNKMPNEYTKHNKYRKLLVLRNRGDVTI